MAYDTPYTPKDNTATLFKNDFKEKETQPDLKGDGMFNGQLVKISAWRRIASNGKPLLSLSIQAKEEQAVKPVAKSAPKQAEPDFDDDMPFWRWSSNETFIKICDHAISDGFVRRGQS